MRPRAVVVTALGIAQILSWGTSFYFPAVLAAPIVADTGWSLGWVVGGASIGLLVAGLIAPRVGALIEERGGRPVLAASSLLFAAGLAGVGSAPSLPVYLVAWAVLGAGMGTGLYDAVFAALGKLYGKEARAPITNLTLFGGFSSTVCWPLSAFLADAVGWRGACFVYAALHLMLALPLQMAVMPRRGRGSQQVEATPSSADPTGERTANAATHQGSVIAVLALVLTIAAGVGSAMVVHLLIFLEAQGASATAAVALGTVFGPAQVGARFVERIFGTRYHPIWTMVTSCSLMAAGLLLLWASFPFLAIAITIYAGGYGVMWIARGTLPLALFGPERYATLIGRLAFPSLIAQAVTPAAGALLIEHAGSAFTIATLSVLASINVLLVAALWTLHRRRHEQVKA
ncbi:MAG: MFS transporter [Hyphomicrobiales bacterium]|nr:MFS transporter [Hyphomicrobiales bacterium]